MQTKKKILITGHTGFKGSWLALWLKMRGHDVYGVSLPPPKESLYTLARISEIVTDEIYLDIRDENKITQWAKKIQPEIVIHLAAQPLVLESYKNPRFTIETNVNGTFNILEKISTLPSTIATLIITTDKVYKDSELNIAYKESDPLGGKDLYSASKAMADILTQSWILSLANKPIVIARAGNVIGGGDFSKNRLVPDIFKSMNTGGKLELRNPHSVRPWQHVLDCLNGYLMALDYSILNNSSDIWNFSPPKESSRSVIELVNIFRSKINVNIETNHNQIEIKETKYLTLDSSKANAELNWRNLLDFETTIDLTANWYLDYSREKNMTRIVYEQIDFFEQKMNEEKIMRKNI